MVKLKTKVDRKGDVAPVEYIQNCFQSGLRWLILLKTSGFWAYRAPTLNATLFGYRSMPKRS